MCDLFYAAAVFLIQYTNWVLSLNLYWNCAIGLLGYEYLSPFSLFVPRQLLNTLDCLKGTSVISVSLTPHLPPHIHPHPLSLPELWVANSDPSVTQADSSVFCFPLLLQEVTDLLQPSSSGGPGALLQELLLQMAVGGGKRPGGPRWPLSACAVQLGTCVHTLASPLSEEREDSSIPLQLFQIRPSWGEVAMPQIWFMVFLLSFHHFLSCFLSCEIFHSLSPRTHWHSFLSFSLMAVMACRSLFVWVLLTLIL